MRYAKIKHNDVSNAPGIAVSFFVQGCPHHCPGCFNPETWDFNGGHEFTPEILHEIVDALNVNGIKRSLCILGGEPLCPENEFLTLLVINTVKYKYPDTDIYIWTGYTYEELLKTRNSPKIQEILKLTHCIIDGPFIEAERDLMLPMRGSRNQRIIYLDKKENICYNKRKKVFK